MHITLVWAIATALSLAVNANPAPRKRVGYMSLEKMKAWVSKLPPDDLTLIGDPFNDLAPRAASTVTVIFCSTVDLNAKTCSGPCTSVTGSAVCINAPNTSCLVATGDVEFCQFQDCTAPCHIYNTCGTNLLDGFCYTPGTGSVGIPVPSG